MNLCILYSYTNFFQHMLDLNVLIHDNHLKLMDIRVCSNTNKIIHSYKIIK